ncbi:GNAT family acetyltransferase [Klebsiella pneumoniae]|uniref:GNAT family acetyltransferase n=1 Tax=Klebsiella pneumoniae TaxID=573 RepID=A0A4P0XRY5_KLEPN|nr:GNAT family acetyltransferase [Klebsiella pneumoniae]
MCEYNQFGQALGVALPDWQPRPWPTRQVLQGSRCRHDRYYRAAVVDSNR